MEIVGVIPARYRSSRFPGKPLVDICGKPMIWWVYQQCLKVKQINQVFVATEDQRIIDVCKNMNINVLLTSDQCATGTDRVGEVAKKIPAELYLNIQGDEPLIDPEVIACAIKPFFSDPNLQVSNLMTKITDPIEVVNFTIPKVITNAEKIGIFLTRSPVPYPKGSISYNYYKQTCVYGFKPEALDFFCRMPRGRIETIEDIEILRFIENGYRVQYVEVDSHNVAVDTPNDLEKVRQIMEEHLKENKEWVP